MHLGSVLDNVGAALLVVALLWFFKRVRLTINSEQKKRCGPVVIGYHLFMAIFFLMSITLTSFGMYCILGDIPIPWILRAIYGTLVAMLGGAGMFEAYCVLERDPHPVDWASEYRRLKSSLRHQLGLSRH